jgi:putative transcriptional regulator
MLAMGRWWPLIAFVAGIAAAQDRGALLVASRATHDADLARTVILVLDHDAHKATGLVLNRPVKIALAEVFPDLKTGAGLTQTAWAGGPIMLGVNALVRSKTPPAEAYRVMRQVYLIPGDPGIRSAIAAGMPGSSFRVYLGVCGWGAGQLENEVERGLWRVVPGSAGAVFDATPATLWNRLIKRGAP